jgi:hypothetical protein
MRKHKLKIAAGVLVALLLGGGYWLFRLKESIHNSYAVWWVADMVVEHLQANSGKWPEGWEDLRDDYQTCVKRSGQPWTFEELSQRVIIDWHADPQQLLLASQGLDRPAFRVISLRDGTTSHWGTLEPNRIILEYLRSPKTPPATPSPQAHATELR